MTGPSAVPTMRPFVAADLDGISGVHWRACRIAYRFMNWSYTEDEVRRWYAGHMTAWDWAQVVTIDGEIVAYLAAIGTHVDMLYVDPDHQGAGLGRLLLEAMLARPLRPVTLHVHVENHPARRFYERLGFRSVGPRWDEQDQALSLVYRRDY
jgi:ribosomal protein S18 acetylase RimI-like enzyme